MPLKADQRGMGLLLPVVSTVRIRAWPVICRIGEAALDAVLLLRCTACGTLVETAGALCPECWSKVRFVTEPLCASCGLPFEFEIGEGAICGGCVSNAPAFGRARAAIGYDDGSRAFILAFKHGDRADAARAFAPWMVRAGRVLLAEADVLAPVPLHWTRLFVRRYNQAALLALEVGRLAEVKVVPDLLVRRKRTPSLGKAGPLQRAQTVRGAFSIPEGRRREVEGRRVLLVDDVFTTGSTVGACARALTRAGARSVDVLTLARVVRPVAPTAISPADMRRAEPIGEEIQS
jgi:ComF family protein